MVLPSTNWPIVRSCDVQYHTKHLAFFKIQPWKGSQPLIPKLVCRFTHVGSSRLIQTPIIVCKVICLLICTNPALREQRIHPITLYSSFTMESSSRFKRLLSISVGYCPIILHRIKQRLLSHVKRACAQGPLSHFAQNTLSTFTHSRY